MFIQVEKKIRGRRYLLLTALMFAIITLASNFTPIFMNALDSGKVLPSAAKSLFTSKPLLISSLHFITIYISMHLLIAGLWYYCWKESLEKYIAQKNRNKLTFLGFIPVLAFILIENNRNFHLSRYKLSSTMSTNELLDLLWWLCLFYIASIVTFSIFNIVRRILISMSHKKAAIVISGLLVSYASYSVTNYQNISHDITDRDQPDIILLGIDSLRIDHVGKLNGLTPSLTPELDELLQNSTIIEDAWTPLGRTFPSWLSVLTGRYPSSHGGIFNLIQRDKINDKGGLAHILNRQEYQTIYAIDETRFSNIDKSYGFDSVVTPDIGAFDFIAGTVSDLPMVNIISNTWFGQWLYPYTHMNRAINLSYKPEVFDWRLSQEIRNADLSKPLFLAVHFELPHWPYIWADSSTYSVVAHESLDELSPDKYKAAVARADQQVGALIQTLEQHGRLNNTVMVILSDHGEAFIDSEPQWISQKPTKGGIPNHAGHGSNAFSVSQGRVLLAFKGWGSQSSGIIPDIISNSTASLTDILPTLAEWLKLNLPNNKQIEGQSLMPLLTGEKDTLTPRAVSIETGFSLQSIEVGNPDTNEIFQQSAHYYNVDDDGRLYLLDEWTSFLAKKKQRASVTGDWILGAMPTNDGKQWNLYLANMKNHKYWDYYQDTPDDAPAEFLLNHLCRTHYDPDYFNLDLCNSHQ